MGPRLTHRTIILCVLVLSAASVLRAQDAGTQTESTPSADRVIDALVFRAMPVWSLNGYQEDANGTPVQGSDVSPITMSFGVGTDIGLSPLLSLVPELWLTRQTYAALSSADKVVPTQLETGSAVGDISDALVIGLSLPVRANLAPAWAGPWTLYGGAGLGLVFRVPVAAVDGSDNSAVSSYWISGRFLYPQLQVGGRYPFNERLSAGMGLDWYIPIYNAWAQSLSGVPFLDETMLRWGLDLAWQW